MRISECVFPEDMPKRKQQSAIALDQTFKKTPFL
jgi:hypothetical protein